MTFNAGARTAVVGTDPLTSFTSSTAGTVTSGPSSIVKPGETYTVVPKFEYKIGGLVIEGKFAGSDSKSWYNPLARKGSVMNAGGTALAGVQFRAQRSSLISADWKITQIAGPDFGLGNGFSNPVLVANDGRYGRTQVYSGDITATYKTNTFLPVAWKAGVKRKHEVRDFIVDTESKRYAYTGPGAGPGVWAGIPSPFLFDVDSMKGSTRRSPAGRCSSPTCSRSGSSFRITPNTSRSRSRPRITTMPSSATTGITRRIFPPAS
jgi:iron complex outermembrane receptor protein